jgi:hypothetical protein
MFAKRNPWALAGWGVLWALVFWFVGVFLAGFVAGALNPENGAAAGREAGRLLTPPFLLLSAILSGLLTYRGVMPGTRRKVPPAAEAISDLDALERLGALHRSGVLNDEEFASQKAMVLARAVGAR